MPRDPAYPSPDAFDLLGLPACFDLSRQTIERAYLARSRRFHPDLVGADVASQATAQRMTAELNLAARGLRNLESRANLLLARLGGPTKESDKSLPPGFLQSVLETRMQIEESRGDPEQRVRWEQWAQDQRNAYANAVATMFRSLAPGAADATTRIQIRQSLNAWRYIERLIEQLDPGDHPGMDLDSTTGL